MTNITKIAKEIALIEWLLSFEQPQERIEPLQRDLAALQLDLAALTN